MIVLTFKKRNRQEKDFMYITKHKDHSVIQIILYKIKVL